MPSPVPIRCDSPAPRKRHERGREIPDVMAGLVLMGAKIRGALGSSSSAHADDPVAAERENWHCFSSSPTLSITGCPAFAGHDVEEKRVTPCDLASFRTNGRTSYGAVTDERHYRSRQEAHEISDAARRVARAGAFARRGAAAAGAADYPLKDVDDAAADRWRRRKSSASASTIRTATPSTRTAASAEISEPVLPLSRLARRPRQPIVRPKSRSSSTTRARSCW